MTRTQTSTRFWILLSIAVLAFVTGAAGCVSSRDPRNGVFNENQYVRKDFLIRPADGSKDDPGWMLKASIVRTSTPNPLGSGNFFITPGMENGGALVRFRVTNDKLQMLSLRELTSVTSPMRTEEVVNAWPATNVDLKYRVNLDGETTNFYEENQEQPWEKRQWVKLNFAKNDMSDVAPLGGVETDLLGRCTDVANATATLVPGSFNLDEKNQYMQWVVQITLPLHWLDNACLQAMSSSIDAFQKLGRQNVTFDLMYSLVRATPMKEVTYKPLVVSEKDPIRRKYGFFDVITINRDEDSGQLAARQLVQRWDPTKPIVWYFAEGFPEAYKSFFIGKGGIGEQTNAILAKAGAAARVTFKNYDADLPEGQAPRRYGDIRYSMLVWMSDRDTQDAFAGVTPSTVDPRTGEVISSSILLNDFAIKDYYVQRIDAYLKSVGASFDINSPGEWPDPKPKTGPPVACKDGDTMPIVDTERANNHNGNSSLYQKMQGYLLKPSATYGNLGPRDFIVKQDDDFYRAFFAIIPYQVFADPDMNPFVVREGGGGVYGSGNIWKMFQKEAEFAQITGKIDRGEEPYSSVTGPEGLKNATAFLNNFRELTINHRNLEIAKTLLGKGLVRDEPSSFSFESMIARDARHCITGADGKTRWETKKEWVENLITTYWYQTTWHEFGHAMGLAHNFMASIDRPNFPHYQDLAGRDHIGLYASSVMEYNASPDRIFWHAGWGPYDAGAIGWMYANDAPDGKAAGTAVSGQLSPTSPWKDPLGWSDDGKTEKQFLYCTHQHLKYTPFCRQGDSGTTPSEIVANAVDAYEWQYQWRNFRVYRKLWNNSRYASAPATQILEARRFISTWIFDWGASDLINQFRRIGITNPDPVGSSLQYFTQLTNKFNAEASAANQMVAAVHKAIIQQSSGERPFRTLYDKYYGDVTQQGIILDKLFAMQGFVAMWPTDNYDPNQAGGYIASYSGIGDQSYQFVAEDAVTSMIGGQYDVYPYFVPLAVAQFAHDTHSPSFNGRIEVRDWIGGRVFTRVEDFLTYFRDIAVTHGLCTNIRTCDYDPRVVSDNRNEFIGPDKRQWIWSYVIDRNTYVAATKDRHIATYKILRAYNDDIVFSLDDGAYPGAAYGVLLPVKYVLDSFNTYN